MTTVRRRVELTGGPLDGVTVRVHVLDQHGHIRVPGNAGRYVEDAQGDVWFWERDARPVR